MLAFTSHSIVVVLGKTFDTDISIKGFAVWVFGCAHYATPAFDDITSIASCASSSSWMTFLAQWIHRKAFCFGSQIKSFGAFSTDISSIEIYAIRVLKENFAKSTVAVERVARIAASAITIDLIGSFAERIDRFTSTVSL